MIKMFFLLNKHNLIIQIDSYILMTLSLLQNGLMMYPPILLIDQLLPLLIIERLMMVYLVHLYVIYYLWEMVLAHSNNYTYIFYNTKINKIVIPSSLIYNLIESHLSSSFWPVQIMVIFVSVLIKLLQIEYIIFSSTDTHNNY